MRASASTQVQIMDIRKRWQIPANVKASCSLSSGCIFRSGGDKEKGEKLAGRLAARSCLHLLFGGAWHALR